jgi:uncharacterized repeat protein (TIGR01451 family)
MFFRRKSHFKRFMVRLGLLGVAGVLGFIAIAQAQRSGDKATEESPANVAGSAEGVVESIPSEGSGGAPADPYDMAAAPHGQPTTTPLGTDPTAANPLRHDMAAPTPTPVGPGAPGPSSDDLPTKAPGRDPFGLVGGPRPQQATSPDQSPSDVDRYRELYAKAGARYQDEAGAEPASRDLAPAAADATPEPGPARLTDSPSGLSPTPARREPSQLPDADQRYDRSPYEASPHEQPTPTMSRPTQLAMSRPRETAPLRSTQPGFEEPVARPIQPRPSAGMGLPSRGQLGQGQSEQGGNGRPGGRHLEGPQTPTLELQKTAPAEIQVGSPATFKITVRNTGNVPARSVRVHDQVPRGARLVGSRPDAQADATGTLLWSLGDLEPGDERVVEVQLLPQTEGEIGSVASLTFSAQASVRTTATKPELQIEANGPRRAMIGEQVKMSIRLTNVGTGAANNLLLFNALPVELRHPAGPEVEYDVGDLAPNETRDIELILTAARPGQITNVITARGQGSLAAEARVDLEIVAPALQVAVDGPRRRYLEREATYTLSVTNPGTAPAHDIELVSHLPEGLEFVSANNHGHYDKTNHAVLWSLDKLPEGEVGSVKLVALAIEPGQHKLRVEGRAQRDLSDQQEETILVEGLPAIFFEVADVEDPVEVGGETAYEIRVLNQGTKTATNIRLAALVPGQLRAVAADGPTRHAMQGGRIIFEPLPRLAPKADTTYRIRVEGVEPGDQRIRVQVQSDEMQAPVTKEESTRVYADR